MYYDYLNYSRNFLSHLLITLTLFVTLFIFLTFYITTFLFEIFFVINNNFIINITNTITVKYVCLDIENISIEIVCTISEIILNVLCNFLLSIKFNIISAIPINDKIERITIYDVFIILFISFVLIKDTE